MTHSAAVGVGVANKRKSTHSAAVRTSLDQSRRRFPARGAFRCPARADSHQFSEAIGRCGRVCVVLGFVSFKHVSNFHCNHFNFLGL